MEVGPYYESNLKMRDKLSDKDWLLALKRCKEHVKMRLFQKTLSGVHSSANLGADPIEHYLGIAYEKILIGEWEWQSDRSLTDQMIRIIDSYISKEVKRKETGTAHLSTVVYLGDDIDFYNIESTNETQLENTINKIKVEAIEKSCKGDIQLELIVEALKEGKKRREIAELLDVDLRQFDKLREKLIKRIDIS